MCKTTPLLVLLCLRLAVTNAVISIENNGYRGITVAIHSNVPDDPNLVQSIQNLFKSGSGYLYQASRHRAYFNEVTIIVPSEWEHRPEYEIVRPNSRFSKADVRIDIPNSEYGDAPYTQQPGECGESGDYVHLTPDFIRSLETSKNSAFGDPGRALIHEWAHLRYGVFDEHGYQHDSRTPPFYMDETGQIRSTSCTREIPGWLRDNTGLPCTRGDDGLPGEDCRFYPDVEHATAKASIMSVPYLPTVEGFCDDTEEMKHNTRAPNMQNLMCRGRSTWDVLMDHPDFRKETNSPREIVDPLPLFRIVQPKKHDNATFVLVLDVSVSMRGKRMELLHRAAARFIRFQLQDYSSVGMVAFHTDVKVLANMTTLDKLSRDDLVDKVPEREDEGYTAIGQGLMEGLQLLTRSREATEGALILLVTDGEENVGPTVRDILPKIIASRVVINTIAFGPEASNRLEALVKATGGKGFFFNENRNVGHKALDAAFLESATTQSDVELQPVEVISSYWFMEPSSDLSGNFTLEKEIGTNTRVLVSFDYPHMQVALVSPSGKKYDERATEHYYDPKTVTISINFPHAESGLWHFFLTNKHMQLPQEVSITVTSEPRDIREQPIRVRSWIAEVDLVYPAQAKVYAEVKKDYNAIVGASVIATIDRPNGEPYVMMLFDSGTGADVTADDGIYSGYFTHFNGSGRYSVEAVVANNGRARMKMGSKGSPTPRYFKLNSDLVGDEQSKATFSTRELKRGEKDMQPQALHLNEISNFERIVSAGSFRLQKWTEEDVHPPSRVTDLEVVTVDVKAGVVTLVWTAPGDDMDSGRAKKIDLRYHTDPNVLLHAFGEAVPITAHDIKTGSLENLPVAGDKQTMSINVTFDDFDEPAPVMYFALVAYDEVGNHGHISNVASSYWVVIEDDDNIVHSPVENSPSLFAILLGLGGLIAFVVVLFAVALGMRNRQRRRKYVCKHHNALLPTSA